MSQTVTAAAKDEANPAKRSINYIGCVESNNTAEYHFGSGILCLVKLIEIDFADQYQKRKDEYLQEKQSIPELVQAGKEYENLRRREKELRDKTDDMEAGALGGKIIYERILRSGATEKQITRAKSSMEVSNDQLRVHLEDIKTIGDLASKAHDKYIKAMNELIGPFKNKAADQLKNECGAGFEKLFAILDQPEIRDALAEIAAPFYVYQDVCNEIRMAYERRETRF